MNSRRKSTLVILIAAALLRITAAVAWNQRHATVETLAFGDSVSYWHLARQIAEGRPYAYPDEHARIFRTPLYPLILAPLFLVFGGEPPMLAGRIVGCLCGVWAVYAVMRLARLLFGDRAAVWAGWAATLYPGAIGMSVFLLAESVFCPLMIMGFDSMARGIQTPSDRRSCGWTALAGAWWGGASLARPSWLLFLPFALPWLWLDRHVPWRRRGVVALASLCGLAAIMLPWWYRSYRLTGHFVLTTLQVGASLYDGLRPGATGGSDMSFTKEFEERFAEEWDDWGDEDYEYALDQAYRRAAKEWALRHPTEAVRLILVKLGRMWKPLPSADLFSRWEVRLVIVAGFLPLFILGVAGIAVHWNRGWTIWLLALAAIYFTILHVVFVSSIRYRQPVMLLWCVPAGWCLAYGWARWRAADRRRD